MIIYSVLGCLSLLLLTTSCMRNDGLSTLAMTQENIWNLSRLEIGMNKGEVYRIMHDPYKTRIIENDSAKYSIWFYVTQASAMDQSRLVRKNVTPLVFACDTLQGWGFEYYNRVLNNKIPAYHYHEDKAPDEGYHLEKTIEELESRLLLSQNQITEWEEVQEKDCPNCPSKNSPLEEEECPNCHPKKHSLKKEDEKMIDEANDQNFNFW